MKHDLVGHTDKVASASFSPDSKYIATASHNNTLKIWVLNTGKIFKDNP